MSVTLYDSKGNFVQSELEKQVVTPSIGSVRSPYDPSVASGLTPEKLGAILRAAANGDVYDYLVLAAQMEQRDPHYFSVLQTRKLALAYLPRKIEALTDDPIDVEIAEFLTEIVNRRGFTQMLIDSMDALNKRFSVVEILWDKNDRWIPDCYIFRKQHWFKFDSDTASELRIRDINVPEGIPLNKYKYIVHAPVTVSGHNLDGGLARQVAAMHLFKSYALKSWMAFAEVFGMPIRIGKYAPGANPDDKAMLRKAVTSIGADAAAIIPTTMEIEFERAAASGFAGSDEFFVRLTNWLDRQVSKAVLGQNMIDEDGGSFAKSKTLQLVRQDIRNADARQLEDTINRDLIEPIVDLNFGKRERYPKFRIDTDEPEDLLRLSQALIPFIDRGMGIEESVIRDKFNIPEPSSGAEVIRSKRDMGENEAIETNFRRRYYEMLSLIQEHTNMREFKRELSKKG